MSDDRPIPIYFNEVPNDNALPPRFHDDDHAPLNAEPPRFTDTTTNTTTEPARFVDQQQPLYPTLPPVQQQTQTFAPAPDQQYYAPVPVNNNMGQQPQQYFAQQPPTQYGMQPQAYDPEKGYTAPQQYVQQPPQPYVIQNPPQQQVFVAQTVAAPHQHVDQGRMYPQKVRYAAGCNIVSMSFLGCFAFLCLLLAIGSFLNARTLVPTPGIGGAMPPPPPPQNGTTPGPDPLQLTPEQLAEMRIRTIVAGVLYIIFAILSCITCSIGILASVNMQSIPMRTRRIMTLVQIAGILIITGIIIAIAVVIALPSIIIVVISLVCHLGYCAVCYWPWPACYGLQLHWFLGEEQKQQQNMAH